MKKFFVPAFVFFSVLLAAQAFSFDGNGGSIDLNYGAIGVLSDGNAQDSGKTLSGGFLLTTIPTGTFTTTDGNTQFKVGVYFDSNLPVVTITSPANGSSTQTNSAQVVYSAVAAGNPIKIFWVAIDGVWANNGFNTSYSFTNLTSGSHTISVVATDAFDLNSATATTTITVNPSSSSGTTTTSPAQNTASGNTGGGGTGGGVTPAAQPEVTVQDIENPASIVKSTTYEPVNATISGGITVGRQSEYLLVKNSSGGTSPVYSFTVGVKNDSSKPYENVKVREIIPKAIASNISQVSFKVYPQTIINPDPEVEWLVEELKPGQEANFLYFVTSLADPSIANDFNSFVKGLTAPSVVAQAKQVTPECLNVTCDDHNICTNDYCSAGTCVHTPRDGINCGENAVCKAGKCVPQTPIPPAKAAGSGIDIAGIAVALAAILAAGAIVAAIIGAIYYAMRHKKLF